MKKAKKLIEECKSRSLNCSITYQHINDYSVEIYRGYESSYQKVFYTDGHLKSKKAIKSGLKYLTKKKL